MPADLFVTSKRPNDDGSPRDNGDTFIVDGTTGQVFRAYENQGELNDGPHDITGPRDAAPGHLPPGPIVGLDMVYTVVGPGKPPGAPYTEVRVLVRTAAGLQAYRNAFNWGNAGVPGWVRIA